MEDTSPFVLVESEGSYAVEGHLSHSVYIQGSEETSLEFITAGVEALPDYDPGWRVSMLPSHQFQIVGSCRWTVEMERQGFVMIGLTPFPVVPESRVRPTLDPRLPLKHFWVRVCGVPYGWLNPPQVFRMFPFGKIKNIPEIHQYMRDLRWVRMDVEMPSRGAIPSEKEFTIRRPNGDEEKVLVRYVVEGDPTPTPFAAGVLSQPVHVFDFEELERAASQIKLEMEELAAHAPRVPSDEAGSSRPRSRIRVWRTSSEEEENTDSESEDL